jgi:hypothetical protein
VEVDARGRWPPRHYKLTVRQRPAAGISSSGGSKNRLSWDGTPRQKFKIPSRRLSVAGSFQHLPGQTQVTVVK